VLMGLSKKSVYLLIGLLTSSIAVFVIVLSQNNESSKSYLTPKEVIEYSNSQALTTSSFAVETSFSTAQSNGVVFDLGNKEEKVTVFILNKKVFAFVSSKSAQGQTSISKPISIPVPDSKNENGFTFEFNEKKSLLKLSSSLATVSWVLPGELGISGISQLRVGNLPGTELQVLVENNFDFTKILGILLGALLGLSFLIFFRTKNTESVLRKVQSAIPSWSTKLAVTFFAIGIVAIGLLSSSPPAKLLTAAKIDLESIETSDLYSRDQKIEGGWLFANSPELGLKANEYVSTLKFDFEVYVDDSTEFRELFVYGMPPKITGAEGVKDNLEISVTGNQRVKFKVPGELGRNEWASQRLEMGKHRIHGEIRNGREIEISVDDKLVYAMSSHAPYYLLQEPNLLLTDYLLDNIASGEIKWEIKSSELIPVRYALDRIQQAIGALFVFMGLFLYFAIKRTSNSPSNVIAYGSNDVLKIFYKTLIGLSILGISLWIFELQPAQGAGWPKNTPLFLSEYRFSDFTQLFLSAQQSDPYSVAKVSYPPFGLLMFDSIGFMSARQATLLVLVVSWAVIASIFWNAINFATDLNPREKVLLMASAIFSFPLLFAFDRGNLDVVAMSLVLLAFWLQKKQSSPVLSGVILGISSAIKIYPLLLLPIFYYRSKSKKLIISTLGTFSILSLIGAIAYGVGPRLFVNSILLGSSGQSLIGDNAIRWNGSLAGFVTTLARIFAPNYESLVWNVSSNSFSTLVLLSVGIGLIFWLAMKKASLTNFAAAWCAVIVLAFPSTPTYRFTIFLLVLFSFILDGATKELHNKWFGILLAVIMSPVVYWYFGLGSVSTFSIIVPIAVTMLLASCIRESKGKDQISWVRQERS
jgi:hypothetical protein